MSFKVLFIDIETVPIKTYVWDIHDPHISPEMIIEPSRVLCFSAKWLGERNTLFSSEQGGQHKRMIKHAHDLINEADAVCHYNGISFDDKRLNTEFLLAKLPPPAPTPRIDLYRTVAARFHADSNKLAYWLPFLQIGKKIEHEGFKLWPACISGEKWAWKSMEKYNRNDTDQLEPFYLRLLPWIANHPNINMYGEQGEERRCPKCGSTRVESKGLKRATTYTYRRLTCRVCGAWSKERLSLKTESKPPLIGL